ncbi:hypothetical protein ACHAPJ_011751 [Fusarium lateritium]
MQPAWVPPNVKFEIDDATQPWTWPENTLDFVHIRFLNGAIKDWNALFREAYRCCKPGGFVESGEFDPRYYCDDGTAASHEVIKTWNSVFELGGKKLGLSFTVIEDGIQETGIRNAGFEDVNVITYKAPVGAWAKDKKLAEVGRYTQLTLENDMEGYTLFLWTNVLGWPKDEYQTFLMGMRKVLRNTANIHIYCKYKYVYGQRKVTAHLLSKIMSKRDCAFEDSEDIRLMAEKRRKTDASPSESQTTNNATNEHYTVGWICAITTEYVAAQVFLDEKHEQPEYTSPHDNNDYTLGRIGPHNVVIAVMPDGEYGISSAATTARDMLHSFPNIKIGLMVGIGGGSPSRHDIRLGDVVVSASRNGNGAVLQYDFGKTVQQQRFRTTGYLNLPPVPLRTAMSGLKAQYEIDGHDIEETINRILEKKPRLARKFRRPDASSDRLYRPDVLHPTDKEASCESSCGLDHARLIQRPERVDEEKTKIHYGLIASANQLMKDALIRDLLAAENDVLCYEMEAAGMMNHFPCLVVRGICDYSDSHKNKEWQGYAAMVAAAYTKALLYRISSNKVEAERRIGDILAGEREAMLRWLTPIDYALQQSDYNGRRQEGTGQWFLRSPEFQAWVKPKKKTLFCPGIPGAGKTIITSLVIDKLYARRQKDPSIGFAYLYCDFRRKDEQDIVSLLAGLLKQLSETQDPLPEEMQQLYVEYKKSQNRPSRSELMAAMTKAIGRYSQVYIIIDALDECQIAGCRTKLLSEIFKLQVKVGINIFCTSRPIPEIMKSFEAATYMNIRAQDEDLHHYLAGNMDRLPSFVLSNDGLQKNIKDTISKIANGMFLLATLHIDSLAQQPTIGHIKRALKTLPTGLSDTYDQAMIRIECQSGSMREMAKKVLSWVIYARKALSPTELQHAIAIQAGQTDLDPDFIPGIDLACSICAGLVTIDTERNVVRLVHYTTQEYFDQAKTRWFTDINSELASICITYLSFDVFASGPCQTDEELKKRLLLHRLYHYAACYWGYHALNASVLTPETLNFLKRTQNVKAASQVMMAHELHPESLMHTEKGPGYMMGLHMAAYFGLADQLKILLRDHDPNVKDSNQRTPLWYAAASEYDDIVRLLLENGAELTAKDKDGRTPLIWTAYNGKLGITRILLKAGFTLNINDGEYNSEQLQPEIMYGGEEAVRALLKKGIDSEARDRYERTPLWWAVFRGLETIVEVLLQHGVDPEIQDNYGQTPLLCAAQFGYSAIVKQLLGRNANIERKGTEHHMTALSWAAANGNTETVKVLLELGADPDSEDRNGRTPLAWAALQGHSSLVKLLLQTGVRPDSKDHKGRTPLSIACVKGDETIVRSLLQYDVDIEQTDKEGRTPLSCAIQKRHENILEVLLSHGAKSKVHNPGQTPQI